jgi:hypothetical protein
MPEEKMEDQLQGKGIKANPSELMMTMMVVKKKEKK